MTKLCARGKAAAKRKFKVYPSAYANAYASKICAGKIKDPSGKKRKDWGPKKMNKGGGADMSKLKTKKKNIYKKTGDPVIDRLMFLPKILDKVSEKIAPMLGYEKKMNKGGYFDEQKTNVKGKKTTGPVKGGKTPQIPPSEFNKYQKFKKNKVVSAKVGKAVTAGSQSAIGRLEKSGLKMRGGGIAIKGTKFKGVF